MIYFPSPFLLFFVCLGVCHTLKGVGVAMIIFFQKSLLGTSCFSLATANFTFVFSLSDQMTFVFPLSFRFLLN